MKTISSLILALIFISGCETTYMSHQGSDGSFTISRTSSILMRSHARIEKFPPNNIHIRPSKPFKVPETSSNETGFGGLFSSLISIATRPPKTSKPQNSRAIEPLHVNSKEEAFIYDHDSDSEPGVRTIRNVTVGLVTGEILK